jgi:hypothetical protein
MPMSLNKTEHMYTVTASLHKCFMWNDMPMSLNGTEHMYIVMASLHKMFY